MSAATGLSAAHRTEAYKVVAHGAQLLLNHAAQVHYTEGPQRWEGIQKNLRVGAGQYINYGDCSSTATWLLWNALTHVHPGMRDVVNGTDWKSGYTGTIVSHGQHVASESDLRVGDLILYGPAPTYAHVTVALGGGMCFSHGSEAGPFKLAIDYRPDRGPMRRFI